MAYESTRAYYDKQAQLAKDNADIAYNMALADLGRRFGIANRRLETNLESRGILRSGEANTARTEMTAEEEAAKTAAEMTKLGAYNQADMTLAGQLAALQAGSGSSGSTPSTTTTTPTSNTPTSTSTPTSNTPAPTIVRPPNVSGSADTMERQLTPKPIDFSGVDFNALGRMMAANQSQVKATGVKQTPTYATTGLYGTVRTAPRTLKPSER
jgi:hypothetical protein